MKLQYRLHLILLGIPGLYCQESNTSHQLCKHQNESPLILWFFQLMMWTVFIHSPMINYNWMFCGFIWLYYIEFSKYVTVLQRSPPPSPPYCLMLFIQKYSLIFAVKGFNNKWESQVGLCLYSRPRSITGFLLCSGHAGNYDEQHGWFKCAMPSKRRMKNNDIWDFSSNTNLIINQSYDTHGLRASGIYFSLWSL